MSPINIRDSHALDHREGKHPIELQLGIGFGQRFAARLPDDERGQARANPALQCLSGRVRSCSRRCASHATPLRCRHIPRPWLPPQRKAAAAVPEEWLAASWRPCFRWCSDRVLSLRPTSPATSSDWDTCSNMASATRPLAALLRSTHIVATSPRKLVLWLDTAAQMRHGRANSLMNKVQTADTLLGCASYAASARPAQRFRKSVSGAGRQD